MNSSSGAVQPQGPVTPGMVLAGGCERCGAVFHPVRDFCPECTSTLVRPTELDGRGTVYSFAEVHLGVSEAFKERVPYTMALVDTRSGLRILTDIIDAPAEPVEMGQEVVPVYAKDGSGRTVLVYRREDL